MEARGTLGRREPGPVGFGPWREAGPGPGESPHTTPTPVGWLEGPSAASPRCAPGQRPTFGPEEAGDWLFGG